MYSTVCTVYSIVCTTYVPTCIHFNVQMITSAGGCCDCGDPEAWTDGVHCTLHEPKESTAMEEDVRCVHTTPNHVLKASCA